MLLEADGAEGNVEAGEDSAWNGAAAGHRGAGRGWDGAQRGKSLRGGHCGAGHRGAWHRGTGHCRTGRGGAGRGGGRTAGPGPPGPVHPLRRDTPASRRFSQAGRLPGLGLRRPGRPVPGPGRPRRGPLVVRARLSGSSRAVPARCRSSWRPARAGGPRRIIAPGSFTAAATMRRAHAAAPEDHRARQPQHGHLGHGAPAGRTGETVLGSAARLQPGGKGANQAVAAARLGASVRMAGCCGDDDFGRTLRSALEDARGGRQRGPRPGRGGFRARPDHRGRGRRELDHRRARGERPGRAAGGRRVSGHALRRPHPVGGDPGSGPGRRPRPGARRARHDGAEPGARPGGRLRAAGGGGGLADRQRPGSGGDPGPDRDRPGQRPGRRGRPGPGGRGSCGHHPGAGRGGPGRAGRQARRARLQRAQRGQRGRR